MLPHDIGTKFKFKLDNRKSEVLDVIYDLEQNMLTCFSPACISVGQDSDTSRGQKLTEGRKRTDKF